MEMKYAFATIISALIYFIIAEAFIEVPIPTTLQKSLHVCKNINHDNIICQNCNERAIYKNYLLSLRKIRRTVKTSNVDGLLFILNFTNNLLANNSILLNNTQTIDINNEEVGLKKIVMANMHLDVSNVKYIQISTKKDTIIVELDKKNKLNNILNDINHIDALINTLSLLLKFGNVF
jgi:hypothetical protein